MNSYEQAREKARSLAEALRGDGVRGRTRQRSTGMTSSEVRLIDVRVTGDGTGVTFREMDKNRGHDWYLWLEWAAWDLCAGKVAAAPDDGAEEELFDRGALKRMCDALKGGVDQQCSDARVSEFRLRRVEWNARAVFLDLVMTRRRRGTAASLYWPAAGLRRLCAAMNEAAFNEAAHRAASAARRRIRVASSTLRDPEPKYDWHETSLQSALRERVAELLQEG